MARSSEQQSTRTQSRYDRTLRTRLRVADVAAWLRSGGIQLVWLLVLAAGAAIPLTQAVAPDAPTWIIPTLGFLVVVGAGVERIFSRTTPAAVALDVLRRELARERRLHLTTAGAYAGTPDPDRLYVERVEAHIATYDGRMTDYRAHQLEPERPGGVGPSGRPPEDGWSREGT
ncbi:hypothetical protein [Isoptericola sp. 178]|uniref:hypothetical protein n=1 Tax=Isoptericola sp. 178 TaxID=3064651 RepID=UPI002712C82C|nr:hypothetical protein [Isoptericola sp. 178]MDO8143790.1 hypothetical protein [Isoptericola sp. 178]